MCKTCSVFFSPPPFWWYLYVGSDTKFVIRMCKTCNGFDPPPPLLVVSLCRRWWCAAPAAKTVVLKILAAFFMIDSTPPICFDFWQTSIEVTALFTYFVDMSDILWSINPQEKKSQLIQFLMDF